MSAAPEFAASSPNDQGADDQPPPPSSVESKAAETPKKDDTILSGTADGEEPPTEGLTLNAWRDGGDGEDEDAAAAAATAGKDDEVQNPPSDYRSDMQVVEQRTGSLSIPTDFKDSAADSAAEESGQEAAKVPVHEPYQGPSQVPGQESVKEPSREPSQESGQESAKEPLHEPSQESSQEPGQESGKESVRETLQESSQESGQEYAKDPDEDPDDDTPPHPPEKDHDKSSISTSTAAANEKKPPTVPDSDTTQKQPDHAEENNQADDSQSEIQSIMEQFARPARDNAQEEIMSPRLELAGLPHFPPRKSSLEHLPVKSTTTPAAADAAAESPGKEKTSTTTSERPSVSRRASSSKVPPPPAPELDKPFDFHRFLEQLRHRTADPVAKFLRSFLMEFGKRQWMVHEQVKIISDFLIFIANKMALCEVWRDVSDSEFDNAKEGMEKLVMNRLYSQTFSPSIPAPPIVPRSASRSKRREIERRHGPWRRGVHQEDVERDEVLAQKIRIYGWVREQHLDIPLMSAHGVRFLSLAQQGGCDAFFI